jgi:aminoglycoside phosphotransferase
MILEIPALVRQFVTDPPPGKHLSVARIETTNPVYLVFDETSDAPRWVVRVGPRATVSRDHDTLRALHSVAPTLVPRSIYCGLWKDTEWVHIQSGLKGSPWFRLQHSLETTHDWSRIKTGARDALRLLHTAIRANPSWIRGVDLAAELQRQRDRTSGLRSRSVAIERALDAAHLALLRHGPTPWFSQHGDFCLNNLLFTESTVGVIDFEEFGLTAMPLHDEFGLVLSFADLTPRPFEDTLADHVASVLADVLHTTPWLTHCLEGLFLHHLLWRISQCSTLSNRASVMGSLQEVLERYGTSPQDLFAPVRRGLREGTFQHDTQDHRSGARG